MFPRSRLELPKRARLHPLIKSDPVPQAGYGDVRGKGRRSIPGCQIGYEIRPCQPLPLIAIGVGYALHFWIGDYLKARHNSLHHGS